MKKSSIAVVVFGVILIAIVGIIVRITPDAVYVHDYSTDDHAYILVYGDTVLTSYGDMTVESSTGDQANRTLVLKYKVPGEKGNNFRRTLSVTDDAATLDGIEYPQVSAMNVFQPALYKKPAEYFMTIFMMR